jgi:hypothetical protein
MMTRTTRFAFVLPLVIAGSLALLACSSSDSTPSGGDGGAGPAASSGTTLSCLVQLNGFEPQCQFYEATGTDAVATIASIRAGCVDEASATAKVLDACPTAEVLGGCKQKVEVKGGKDVALFETNFEYVPSADAGSFAHKTTEEVQTFCASEGEGVTFVASP